MVSPNQTNPILYPSRLWDSGSKAFVENINKEQSSENFTTVAVKKTNEVLGFPLETPIDEMENAINGDLYGTISEAKPSFYDKMIRAPLSKLGMSMFQPRFITDVKPTAERAFLTSMARTATADIIKPDFSDKEAQAFPAQAFAGNLAGTLIGLKGVGKLLEAVKLPGFTAKATAVLTKAAKGERAQAILAKAVPGAIGGAATGGVYRGISETATQVRDSSYPDIAKIGEAALHDALWFGASGAVVGPMPKYSGAATMGGIFYLMAKVDGASEQDALLNAGVGAGFHLMSGSHAQKPKVRKMVVDNLQRNVTDYVQAKNPLVDPHVAQQTGREYIQMKAEEALASFQEKAEGGFPVAETSLPKGKNALDQVLASPEATKQLVENIAKDFVDVKEAKKGEDNIARDAAGKPIEVPPRGTEPFVERRKSQVSTFEKRRLKDWTDVVDQYDDVNRFSAIDKLPIPDAMKGRLISHYDTLNKPKSIPEFTGNKSTDAYGEKIKGDTKAITDLEIHVTKMVEEKSVLVKEDAADSQINPAREKRMGALSSQISLANDALRVAKGEFRGGDQPKTIEDLTLLEQRLQKSTDPKEREQIAQVIDKFIRENPFKASGEKNVAQAEGIKKATDLSSESGQLTLPSEQQTEAIYQKTFNRFQSIENTVTKAKELGADIKPGEDAGASADRFLSDTAQARVTLEEGTYRITKEGQVERTGEGLKAPLDSFSKKYPGKDAEQDLNDYLIAVRTIEDLQRPARGREENIASPEQVATAQATLAELTSKYQTLETFQAESARIYDFQKRNLRTLVDSGLMTEDVYQKILNDNPHYIPFDRILPDETSSDFIQTKGRFSGVRSPVKTIKGSELGIHNPIESIIKNTYKIHNAAARNKVFQDIYRLKDIPELNLKEMKADFRPIEVSAAETGDEALTIFRPSQFKPKGNVIEGFIDGKRKYLEVPENLKNAMDGLNEQSSSWLVKILSQPAHWLRTGATITPEFIIRNPLRDQFSALQNTQVGFRPFFDSIGSIADIVKKTEVYNDWIRSGGAYAGFVELSRPGLGKMLKDLRGQPNLLKNLNIVERLQDVSQLFEQATRVGVFKAGRRTGLTDVEAAKASREGTLNFQRRGSQTKDINSVIPFFNAGLQGVDQAVRSFQRNPKGYAFKAAATITLPSLLLYLHNREEEDYFELPRWQRDLFWNFKIQDQWYSYPKQIGIGQIFGSLPERLFEYIDRRDSSSLDGMVQALYDSLSPVSGDPMSGLIPTAIKPLIENSIQPGGYSFFRNRPIVPEGKQDLIPSEQYNKYDTETAKALGYLLNVSPSKIENLVSGWLGGSGRYSLQAGDKFMELVKKVRGEKLSEKRPTELSDIPLVKGFARRDPVGFNSESVKNFFKEKDRLEKLNNTYNKFKKSKEQDKANRLKAKNPDIRFADKMSDVAGQITDLNKKVDEVVKSEKLSDDDKRERISQYEKQMTKLARDFNKKLKGANNARR